MKKTFIILALLGTQLCIAQSSITKKLRVLYIGNSYIGVNNLPLLVENICTNMDDTIIYDSNTPGGTTIAQHTTNASVTKIMQGTWDKVITQCQSQEPSFPIAQVQTSVFPYAKRLDSIVHATNTCGRTMYYMTWGRKNGDASNCGFYPPLCTYVGMDSLLRLRYTMMADSNNAEISPVSVLWRYLRDNHASIELYNADESHPSLAGSYAAACCFYTVLFKKDPTLISYNPGITATEAATIKTACKQVVFNNLSNYYIGKYDAKANFTYTLNNLNISCTNTSTNATTYAYFWGDGTTSTSGSHTYANGGTYTVKLVAYNCGQSDTLSKTIVLSGMNISKTTLTGFKMNVNQNNLVLSSADFAYNNCVAQIIDMHGRLIVHRNLSNNITQEINLDNCVGGAYILKIIKNNILVATQKFSK